ncbi:hypothetical protein AWB81_05892 [Caballeronia arationis]|uniref:hypothetical protein n=1 Tax=Caballeronia arationis TaxID=1777142 RepID=UPI00074CD13D|nr:hypothetical protein [Caballeronia arationis]SAL00417.1 hypothetical protein AWB81_05892 [Caballeronia arationis]
MDPYEQLFEKYVQALNQSRPDCEAWWARLNGIPEELLATNRIHPPATNQRWPCGSVSHPALIAVFRHYYIECKKLNEANESPEPEPEDEPDEDQWQGEGPAAEPGEEVPPFVFCFDWLSGKQQALSEWLARLVFSPVGNDDPVPEDDEDIDPSGAEKGPLRFDLPAAHPYLKSLDSGIQRLIEQPYDLLIKIGGSTSLAQAHARRRDDFHDYVAELTRCARNALTWWHRIRTRTTARLRSEERALHQMWWRRPAGPASYPDVVSVIRRHWLRCASRNENAEFGPPIAPQLFVLGWLVEANLMELAHFLAPIPYWPMGFDADGRWV